MNKYDNAIKIMEERCGNDKEVIIALATISLSPNANGNPRPAVRMVCAYYEDGVFYVSTDARKNKSLQIEKNNEVSVSGLDWFAFYGTAENLGWVKDEKNAKIRAKFKKVFDWFDEVGDEDNPNSIVLRITLTEGTITDNEKKYGEEQYHIDFINKTVKC
ncbi:pyridoxamine 5'-phosphate oxidase family protein [Dysgonomonas macrotermitis]|uniref:Pyridoxamine 5'-phosphate oxidase n=1 Tax=Dysgonomonas macrotermitis TaxID=1346286 RepID=A0A1M4ZVM1_9BACT|nr:pyridoxamine 5'-phosphate oxidase family protein [Dysgonomonas macrotermitis]SHF21646.1 Pyridoxamine 5'-phosphate oxidase [Dysgonomonas macrotermitis]